MNTKLKEDQKSKEADVRLSKKVLSGTRHSEEIKIDRLTYEKMKKFESKLETLHENLEDDDDEEENNKDDQKIESNIRNTMNYKIQENSESLLTSNISTDRNSELSNYVRYSYNRSSTRSYNESLNKKHNSDLIKAIKDDKSLKQISKQEENDQERNPSRMEREIFEYIPRAKGKSQFNNDDKITQVDRSSQAYSTK